MEEIQERGTQFFREQFLEFLVRGLIMQVGISVNSLFIETFFCCFTEVLAEGSPRPLSSVPDVTHHLVTMQSGRQSYEVSVLTAVNPQEVKPSLAFTLFLWTNVESDWESSLEDLKNSPNFNLSASL